MKGLERLFKFVSTIAAIAAASMAILYIFRNKKDRLDDLNDYLMGDDEELSIDDQEDEKIQDNNHSDLEYLERDLNCLDELDATKAADLAFLVNPEYLEAFQNTLADAGYSSDYNPDTKMLEMLLTGPTDQEEMHALCHLLDELLTSTKSTYLGFALH